MKQEKEFLKVENRYFKLLVKSQQKGLRKQEEEEMLLLMAKRIAYLQEEWQTKKEQNQEIECIDPITDGLFLIQDLKLGFSQVIEYPNQENIEQFAAHYQAVLDYEQAFLSFEQGEISKDELEERKEEAKDLKEGYQEKPKEKTMKKTRPLQRGANNG